MRRALLPVAVFSLLVACVKDDSGKGKTGPSVPISIGDAWVPPLVSDAQYVFIPQDTRPPGPDTAKDALPTVKRDTAPTATIDDAAAPTGGMCDLLKQNCLSKAMACYPVGTTGICQTAGGVGEGGPCYLGADPPLCAPGLTCITGVLQGAVCLVMCDVFNPVPYCGQGNACQPLPKFSTVGYCQPG